MSLFDFHLFLNIMQKGIWSLVRQLYIQTALYSDSLISNINMMYVEFLHFFKTEETLKYILYKVIKQHKPF